MSKARKTAKTVARESKQYNETAAEINAKMIW